MKKRRMFVALMSLSMALTATVASAQGDRVAEPPAAAAARPADPADEPPDPAPPVATTPSAIRPAIPAAPRPNEPPRSYASPMREQCEQELRQDATWKATLAEQLRAGVHEQDARVFATNHKHVIMAYAALWILTVAFVLFMWFRQSALRGEILRLQRDLDRAVGEDGGKPGSKKP